MVSGCKSSHLVAIARIFEEKVLNLFCNLMDVAAGYTKRLISQVNLTYLQRRKKGAPFMHKLSECAIRSTFIYFTQPSEDG